MPLDLDILLLKTFIAVCDTGSITQAADRVGRSQPATSLQIRRLEGLVGHKLISWEKRKLVLTEEGVLLLDYARRIIEINNQAVESLVADGLHGSIALGAPDIYAAAGLPDAIRAFRQRFPQVRIELHCATSAVLMEMVNQGTIDLALLTSAYSGDKGEYVCAQQLEWVIGAQHDFEITPPVPLAVLPPGNLFRDVALAAMRRQEIEWNIVAISESLGGLLAAAYSGLAVTVLPRMVLQTDLKIIPPNEFLPPLPMVDLALVTGIRSSKAIEALKAHLFESLGDL